WLSFADRLDELIRDFHPKDALDRDSYATAVMDAYAMRLLGSTALARAARGEQEVASLSVLKLLASEAVQTATEQALSSARPEAATAQNAALLGELDAAWTRAATDDDVVVIVLRAEGKHFSAGHDLNDRWPDPKEISLEWIYRTEARQYLEYSLRWRNVPK